MGMKSDTVDTRVCVIVWVKPRSDAAYMQHRWIRLKTTEDAVRIKIAGVQDTFLYEWLEDLVGRSNLGGGPSDHGVLNSLCSFWSRAK